MTIEVRKILSKLKGKEVGIFIDDSNIFHRQRETNLFIDWRKFKELLNNNFKIKLLKFYRGNYPKDWKIDPKIIEKNDKFKQILINLGYEVVI